MHPLLGYWIVRYDLPVLGPDGNVVVPYSDCVEGPYALLPDDVETST